MLWLLRTGTQLLGAQPQPTNLLSGAGQPVLRGEWARAFGATDTRDGLLAGSPARKQARLLAPCLHGRELSSSPDSARPQQLPPPVGCSAGCPAPALAAQGQAQSHGAGGGVGVEGRHLSGQQVTLLGVGLHLGVSEHPFCSPDPNSLPPWPRHRAPHRPLPLLRTWSEDWLRRGVPHPLAPRWDSRLVPSTVT